MTLEEQLREQRQALNAALNNRDLETAMSFLHQDFVAKGNDGHSYDRQAAIQQFEQMLQPSVDFQSEVEVENVEASEDNATLRVRRTESARLDNPKFFGGFSFGAAIFAFCAIQGAFRTEQSPFQYWFTIVGYAVAAVLFLWLAFFLGRRSINQTQRAKETWRCVDGRWLLAEEEQIP